jgi:hypothetical protein
MKTQIKKIMKTQTKKLNVITVLFMILLLNVTYPLFAQNAGLPASDLFGRKYKVGEIYRYKLTMEELHDGKFNHINIAICELKVIKDSLGVSYDEVRWVSRKTINAKDTIDATKAALSVKPYIISLDPKGKIDLPIIEIPDMTEPIQDFNTFFVAVSSMVGATKLNNKGDSIINKEPVIADFSNGSYILKGEDCIAFSVKMTDNTQNQVMIHTTFFPPSQSCLSFLTSDMNVPVVPNTINNFQMVMQAGAEKYMVQYGREFFYVNSTIQKSDGKIINATMFNQLNLKLKVNCDKEYKNCQFEMPFSEQRNLILELL